MLFISISMKNTPKKHIKRNKKKKYDKQSVYTI